MPLPIQATTAYNKRNCVAATTFLFWPCRQHYPYPRSTPLRQRGGSDPENTPCNHHTTGRTYLRYRHSSDQRPHSTGARPCSSCVPAAFNTSEMNRNKNRKVVLMIVEYPTLYHSPTAAAPKSTQSLPEGLHG